jgi:exosortase/archaeosortase family protein
MLLTTHIAQAKSQLLRNELFASLFIVGCVNGLVGRAIHSIEHLGLANAILDTFSISVIVFIACLVGISYILDSQRDEIRSADIAVSALLLPLIILPIGGINWLAVATISLYILFFTAATESRRRGAIILLATTVPMLWSRLLSYLFSNPILNMDASLVGLMLGTHRSGNIVEFADHFGTLVILPGCSSLANMSLAILWWVTISQVVRHQWRRQDISWCLFACMSVVAVNVTRLSFMGLSNAHYDMAHSALGDIVTNVIILSLTILICVLGVRREVFPRT